MKLRLLDVSAYMPMKILFRLCFGSGNKNFLFLGIFLAQFLDIPKYPLKATLVTTFVILLHI